MNVEYFRTLYNYHYWANARVWACADALSDADFDRPVSHSVGSIREQLVHIMSAEWIWFSRLRGESPGRMLNANEYPNRAAIQARWGEIETAARGYLAELTEERLMSRLEYRRTDGSSHSNTIWVILTQVVNHGTDHRAQILGLIDGYGIPTVGQDFITFARDTNLD